MYQSTKKSRDNSDCWCCYSFMFVVAMGGWGGSSARLARPADDYGKECAMRSAPFESFSRALTIKLGELSTWC
jgi:hypothetical protein